MPTEIQYGLSTHHQDQLITPHSLSTIKAMPNRPVAPMPLLAVVVLFPFFIVRSFLPWMPATARELCILFTRYFHIPVLYGLLLIRCPPGSQGAFGGVWASSHIPAVVFYNDRLFTTHTHGERLFLQSFSWPWLSLPPVF